LSTWRPPTTTTRAHWTLPNLPVSPSPLREKNYTSQKHFIRAALAETESIVLMNLRGVIRAVEGSEPGAEANVTKLLGSEVVKRKAALAAQIAGPLTAVREGEEKRVGTWLMATLGASIGGGTSEIIRNQIAERLLGLPRDPLIK